MGLIDNLRDERDSWNKRYEEHRAEKEDYDHMFHKQNVSKIEEDIKRNREKVGKFFPISKKI
ncbi:MAG: hypothetical protein ACRENO_00190 [Thermodesulfobacteriota bacterium]